MRNSSAHIRKSYDKEDLLNLDSIICEFCSQPTNSSILCCMNCGRYLQNKNLRSKHDSHKDMYSLEGDFTNKFKSSLVFNETKANWVCTSCKKFNKKMQLSVATVTSLRFMTQQRKMSQETILQIIILLTNPVTLVIII